MSDVAMVLPACLTASHQLLPQSLLVMGLLLPQQAQQIAAASAAIADQTHRK
jgi:hypothetical protein